MSADGTLRARLRSGSGHDEGVTLVELCIAMLVLGVVAVMVATTTIQAFRIQRETTLREADSTSTSLAMEVLTKDVRQALAPQVAAAANAATNATPPTVPAFSVASPTRVTFVTWVGTDPVRVSYVLAGGTLTRSVQQPTSTGRGARSTFGDTVPASTTTLARNVTSTAPFAYVTSSQPDTAVATVTGTADLALVHAVQVDLTVDSDAGGRLPGTRLQNTVACLNL